MRGEPWRILLSVAMILTVPVQGAFAQQNQQGEALVLFDFEDGTQGWVVPGWEATNLNYVAKSVSTSSEVASSGKEALELQADFPQGREGQWWTGAYAERDIPVTDWSQFRAVAVDVYVPAQAKINLTGRLILTVGEKWQWTEMNVPMLLKQGKWTTITANITPSSMNWSFFLDETFRKDIRKLGVRIESDQQPPYKGPVYIDNVRLLK